MEPHARLLLVSSLLCLLGIADGQGGMMTATDVCHNTTQVAVEVQVNVTRSLEESPESRFTYVDVNNTMVYLASNYYWLPQFRVMCIPRTKCVKFTMTGLTWEEFTVRVDDDTPLDISVFEEEQFYSYQDDHASPVFTTELAADPALCYPSCVADEEELLEVVIWGNDGGSDLDWWLIMPNHEWSEPLARCPKNPEGDFDNAKNVRDCAIRNRDFFFIRQCLRKQESYRLVFYHAFGNELQKRPDREQPQIDVRVGGDLVDSFRAFKTRSITWGPDPCEGKSVFELFASQPDHYNYIPQTNYTLFQDSTANLVLLSGNISQGGALHYEWGCVDLDPCLTLFFERDLTIERMYQVHVYVQVDDVVYLDRIIVWDEINGVPLYGHHELENATLSLIGNGCVSGTNCGTGELLVDLELDVHPEPFPLGVVLEISRFTEGAGEWIETSLHNDDENPRLENRTYNYQACLPADQCYVLLGYSQQHKHKSRGRFHYKANSTMRVVMDGNVILDRSFPVLPDSVEVGLTDACEEDSGLSSGQIAGIVVGSIVGVIFVVFVVYKLYYRNRATREVSHMRAGRGYVA